MYEGLSKEELVERLLARDKEVLFLKEELLQSAHQLERIAERVEQQNQASAKLLKLLSPTELPNIPGFSISSKFKAARKGSEYLELLNYKEKNRFGILMSHMEGPGLSALFLAALLKFSPELQSSKKWEPKSFIANLWEDLKEHVSEEHRVSVLYGYFDRAADELQLCCYGPFGILLRETSGKIRIESPLHEEIISSTKKISYQDRYALSLNESLIFLSPGYLKSFDKLEPTAAMNLVAKHLEDVWQDDLNQMRNELFVIQKRHLKEQKTEYDASVMLFTNKDRSLKLATPDS